MRIGLPMPSSRMTWAARSTRSSSPSAKAIRLPAAWARSIIGFITMPERKTKRRSVSR